MSELTFESLLLEIRDSIERCATPTQLTSALASALKNAEQYEDQWINSLYESSEGYESIIY